MYLFVVFRFLYTVQIYRTVLKLHNNLLLNPLKPLPRLPFLPSLPLLFCRPSLGSGGRYPGKESSSSSTGGVSISFDKLFNPLSKGCDGAPYRASGASISNPSSLRGVGVGCLRFLGLSIIS